MERHDPIYLKRITLGSVLRIDLSCCINSSSIYNVSLHESGRHGNVNEWLDSESIVKVKPTVFHDRLDVGYEMKE